MRGEGAALSCEDVLLFGREGKNRSNWDLKKTVRICDSIDPSVGFLLLVMRNQ